MTRNVLVVGEGELAREVVRALRENGAAAIHLRRPSDRELGKGVRGAVQAVAVISHDDILAMRLALVAEHARPGVALLVTIFDATVAAQLVRAVPNCRVVSLADVAGPKLADDCLSGSNDPSRAARVLAAIESQLRAHDASSRLLIYGVVGLLMITAGEVIVAATGLGHPLPSAVYEAAKATTTVGPDRFAEAGPLWYRSGTAVAMLVSTALTAAATAGLVNRLLTRRLVGLVGRRTLPRRDHVIVVGLGQVGLRLCLILRHRGVRVVAIERERTAPNVHLAKHLGIPIVLGDGTERGLLTRAGVGRARALASVTSDDHMNIAVSVAALATRSRLRVVLRAGDDDAVTETRALFSIGVVRDVNRLAAAHLAEIVAGHTTDHALEPRIAIGQNLEVDSTIP